MTQQLTAWTEPPVWHASAEAQREWTPGQWHGLYAHIDRVFQEQYAEKYRAALDAMDPALMTDETKHLMKHVLVLAGSLDRVLAEHPNLAGPGGLLEEASPSLPIRLHRNPVLVYPYLTEHGILL